MASAKPRAAPAVSLRASERRPLDVIGMILFSCGTALLSWLLEIFGEHTLDPTTAVVMLVLSIVSSAESC